MLKWWGDLVVMIASYVWKVEQEMGSGGGEAKKQEAIRLISQHLDSPTAPISWPSWLSKGIRDWLLSFLIDLAVKQLQGFFGK
jgi:hypothetical protein